LPLPLAGEADAPRAMRSIVPSAAGEGSRLLGVLDCRSTLSPTLPRKRGRERTGLAAAI
jgi:hypothetical protein